MIKLSESSLHAFLKIVGAAFLVNQGCFLVDLEVPLTRLGKSHELDKHNVIDVCGVGEKFTTHMNKRLMDYFDAVNKRFEVRQNILRGIEVKVSRSDYKNGFQCSGCNYNYLLTPMRLLAPWEIPRSVGLIEYNRYKFSIELIEDSKFTLRGLRVVRKSCFRNIMQYQIDNAIACMIQRKQGSFTKSILDKLLQIQADL